MTVLREGAGIINALRSAAILGVCAAAAKKVLSAEPLQQNEYFGFYALAALALAIVLAIIVFLPKSATAIWKNPDLLVPGGLYIAADGLLGLFGTTDSFWGVSNGRFIFEGMPWTAVLNTGLKFILVTGFIGWTTRLLLDFVGTGRVNLIESFKDVKRWFPRAATVFLLGIAPIIVLFPLFYVPIWLSISYWKYELFVYTSIFFVSAGCLFWNLGTSALLPHVLQANTKLPEAIREGIRLSWSNKAKVILPVILLMAVSGWIVVLMVTYNSYKNDPGEFGRGLTPYSVRSTTQFTGKFVWTGGYPEENRWHEVLMTTVEAKTLPTIDFRIMLLMLLLSLAVNLEIVGTLWGRKEGFEHIAMERAPAHPAVMAGVALLFLIPFEYVVLNTSLGKRLRGQGEQELVVPNVYRGGDKFTRTELFRYAKSKEERDQLYFTIPGAAAPDPDELELDDIRQVYAGEVDNEPGMDILAAGETKAFILAPDGRVKREVDYKLGRYLNDSYWQDRRMISIEIVDFNNDGKPDIAGKGSNTCEIIDLEGRSLWKYPAEKDEDYWPLNSITVADADNDGELDVVAGTRDGVELFGKDGKRKWTTKTATFYSEPKVVDLDGDGKNEISIGESIVTGKGELKEKIKMPREVFGLLIDENEPASLIYFDDNKMGLFRLEKLIRKYEAPISSRREVIMPSGNAFVRTSVYRAAAKSVKLGSGNGKYLAVFATANVDDKTDPFKILYIYDAGGNLIYHETITASFSGTMAVMPNDDGTESLLITAGGKLFKYSLN